MPLKRTKSSDVWSSNDESLNRGKESHNKTENHDSPLHEQLLSRYPSPSTEHKKKRSSSEKPKADIGTVMMSSSFTPPKNSSIELKEIGAKPKGTRANKHTTVSSPSQVSLSEGEIVDLEKSLRNLTDRRLPLAHYCEKCNIIQPFRAKHCDKCESCVYKFDHHCSWIGGCVGELNHRKFWLFLLLQTAFCVWTFFLVGAKFNKF